MVGVYGSETGVIDVEVNRSGDVLLVLSSYSAAIWNVTAGPSTNLIRVIASSHEPQSVNAGSASADVRSYEMGGQPYPG